MLFRLKSFIYFLISSMTSVVYNNFLNFTLYIDYSFFISTLPILLVMGIITVKKDFLGKLIAFMLLILLTFNLLKDNQIIEFTIIEQNTIIRIIQIIVFLGVLYSYKIKEEERKGNIYMEFTTFILIAILGIFISMETSDLLIIFIALEMQAFTLYTIVSKNRENLFAAEGGLKYFLIGALASACIVLAIALFYQKINQNNLPEIIEILPIPKNGNLFLLGGIIIISGLLFKIGAVPFHLWLPDAYQGAANVVLLFIAIFPKIALAYLIFIINMIVQQDVIIFTSCILSGIVGSTMAASQTKIKRFLAYGIIFNNIYFLAIMMLSGKHAFLGLLESMAMYLVVSFTILMGAFLLNNEATMLKLRSLRDFLSIKKTNIFLGFTLSIVFLSAGGIPPFLGFYQKYFGLFVLIEKFEIFLGTYLIVATILPVYYYLRTTKIVFFLTKSTNLITTNIFAGASTVILSFLLIITCAILFV